MRAVDSVVPCNGVFKLGLLPDLGKGPVHHPADSDAGTVVDAFP